jgi:hypothetical protein
MEQQSNSPKPSVSLLFSHMADWSGWEYLYEERRKVSACVILVVCILLGIGWLVSRKQSSSLGMLIQATNTVNTITKPTSDESQEIIQHASEKLFSLSADPSVLSLFCGVLAQEDVLTKGKELNRNFFTLTSKQLIEQGCPQLSSLVQATLIQENGSKQEALQKIEDLLPQSQLPWLGLYLLIQKAYLLQELGKPNDTVIEELKTRAQAIESVNDYFEDWFHTTPADFFDTLKHT